MTAPSRGYRRTRNWELQRKAGSYRWLLLAAIPWTSLSRNQRCRGWQKLLAVDLLYYQPTGRTTPRRSSPTPPEGRPPLALSALLISSVERPLVSMPRNAKTRPAWLPKGEEQEGRKDRVDCHFGADVVGRADDQREAEGADNLSEFADAVAEPHAAGAQPVWPNLREVRSDDRVAGVAKKKRWTMISTENTETSRQRPSAPRWPILPIDHWASATPAARHAFLLSDARAGPVVLV